MIKNLGKPLSSCRFRSSVRYMVTALGETYAECHSNNKDGVGERYTSKRCSSKMPYHNVVGHLHNHLSCLRNHYRDSKVDVAFVERYVLSDAEHGGAKILYFYFLIIWILNTEIIMLNFEKKYHET